MADIATTDQPTTTPNPAQPVTPPAQTAEERKFTQAEVDTILRERLDREKRTRADAEKAAADKAAAEAAAKNGEWEKLAKQNAEKAAELERKLADMDLQSRKTTIAARMGLPATLAARLTGSTDAEIEADAKTLLEALPKAKPQPGPITNPGANGSAEETREQKRARLFGDDVDIWSGGGVRGL